LDLYWQLFYIFYKRSGLSDYPGRICSGNISGIVAVVGLYHGRDYGVADRMDIKYSGSKESVQGTYFNE
jgi:hypothetical protein